MRTNKIALAVAAFSAAFTFAQGELVLCENFENLSDGPIDGQGGWTAGASDGDNLELGIDSTGNFLGSRVADGLTPPSRPPYEFAYAHHPVDLSGVTGRYIVLSFDGFAVQNSGGDPSHDSGVYLVSSSIPTFGFGYQGIGWFYNRTTGGWMFDARLGAATTDYETVAGGADAPVSLEIVVDRVNLEIWGTYDYGGGNTGETSRYAISAANIGLIDNVKIFQDWRFASSRGVEIDNVVVSTANVPGRQWIENTLAKASNAEAGDEFGWSVAIDGDTAIVGARNEDSDGSSESDGGAVWSGAAYVFVKTAGTWVQQAYLKASNAEAQDQFGWSVAIDGDRVAIGAYFEDGDGSSPSDNSASGSGAVYIFGRSGITWTQEAYLKASNAASGANFGYSVALDGDTVVVGARLENGSLNQSGAAYVFTRSGTVWSQQAYLKASNPGTNDFFGGAVDISGDTVVVGAVGEDSDGSSQANASRSNSGAAYVFKRTGTSWIQEAYLKADYPGAFDFFGSAVAVSGDTVFVGAPEEDSDGSGVTDDSEDGSGAAYVFFRSGTSWSQTQFLKASNHTQASNFGRSVDIDGGVAVVGAIAEDRDVDGNLVSTFYNAGAAYVFRRIDSRWCEEAYLKASNAGASDHFSHVVGVSGGTVVVSAPREASEGGDPGSNTASSAGAVYFFSTGVESPGPGDLDLFDLDLAGGAVFATTMQPDGKMIVGGQFSSILGVPRNNIARLNADGTLDTAFDPNANGDVHSVNVTLDGRILIGGFFTSLQPNGAAVAVTRNRIARLEADGSLDAGFDPNADNGVLNIVEQNDGKIVIGGWFGALRPNGAASPVARFRIARLNSDGTLDSGFNPNPNNSVYCLELQDDGKILAGGDFSAFQPNGTGIPVSRQRIVRLNTDGTVDAGFDPRANGNVRSLALQADGKILIGGDFTSVQPNGGAVFVRERLARLNTDGTADGGFDPAANQTVYCIAVQTDGKVLLGGVFTSLQPNGAASPVPRSHLARVNPDGSVDTGFETNMNGEIFSLSLQADGAILAGGEFTAVQPGSTSALVPRNLFARLLNDPATQSLEATGTTEILWARSGASPEVTRVVFENSTDGGANWTLLGSGSRVVASPSDWEIGGLSLSGDGMIRARGRTTNGFFNSGGGWVESRTSYSFSIPAAATDDSGSTNEDTVLSSVLPGMTGSLLANDAGASLSVTAYDALSARGATVVVNTDGTFSYDPANVMQSLDAGDSLLDTFTYTITDSVTSTSDSAKVTVTVSGLNDAPSAVAAIVDVTIYTSSPSQSLSLFPVFEDPDESDGDTDLSYIVSGNTDPVLVQTYPVDSADGVLALSTSGTLKGNATLTVTATDTGALSGSDTFVVTVIDDEPPVFEVKDIVVNAESAAILDPFVFTATDRVDGIVPVVCVPDASTPFPIGVTEVTCTATDSSGNTAVRTFDVIVLESQQTPGTRYLDVVSLRGDPVAAPGLPAGVTVFTVNRCFLNNSGKVIFDAALSGAGANNTAVLTGPSDGPHTVLALKGDSAPGTAGGVYGIFSNLSLIDGGSVSFQSLVGSSPAQFADTGAGVTLSAIKGGAAPTGGGETWAALQKPSMASDGSLLVTGNLSLTGGVTVYDDTVLASAATVIAREGALSSIPATDYGHLHPRIVSSASNGRYVFSAYLLEAVFDPSDNTAVFSGLTGGGLPQAVVREGDTAGGTGGARFSSFLGEGINSSGSVVVRSYVSGAGTSVDDNEGLWSNGGNPGSPLELVAREGDVAPCLPNEFAAFSRFSAFEILEDGSICFHAYLKNATPIPVVNSANDGSLWLWRDGMLHLIAREGEIANNTAGAVIRQITSFACSGSGALVYDVSLVPGIGDTTTRTNLAVFLDRGAGDPAPLQVLRRGDSFDLTGTPHEVVGIKLSVERNPGGGTGGYGKVINDAGEIILNLTLDQNKSGVFVLGSPPL